MLSSTGERSQGTNFPRYPGKGRDSSLQCEEQDPIPDLCSLLSGWSPIKFRRRFAFNTVPRFALNTVPNSRRKHFRLELSGPKVAACPKLLCWTCESNVDPVDARALPNPKVDVRLPGKGNSNSHGARPVHLIITKIQWIRTSRLSMKNSLSAVLDR